MKNMFQDIADIVELRIQSFISTKKNKQQILEHFGINNTGFREIESDLKQYKWFKHKRKQVIEEIIQQTVAQYTYTLNSRV